MLFESKRCLMSLLIFTQPSSIYNNAKKILNSNVNLVIGTTGLNEEQLEELKNLT